MNTKLFKVIAVVLILVVLLSACAKATPVPPTVVPPTAEPTLRDMQDGKPFVYLGTNMNHPVVKIMELGFWEACIDYDVQCKIMAVDGNDIAGLVAQAETLNAENTSGVTSFFYDVAFFAPAQALIDAGVPVINWHAAMTDELPGLLAWVSADVAQYSANAALEMAEAIECDGVVAITQGSLNITESLVADTFAKTLKKECPKVKVLQSQEEGYDPPTAIAKALAILTGNPEVNGAFSTTGAGPTTWAKAAEEFGKEPGEIIIISMDTSIENLDLIKSGWVYGVVAQPLYEENYKAVELLIAKLKGEEVPFENPLESPIVKLADINKYYELAQRAADFDLVGAMK